MAARHARNPATELTNCKQTIRAKANCVKCRHCLLLYAGECPLPAGRSAHVMQIHCGSCKHAVVHPRFKELYPEEWTNRRTAKREVNATRGVEAVDGEGSGKCSTRRRAM